MKKRFTNRLPQLILASLWVVSFGAVGAEKLSPNLALKAKASASSQFDGSYRPALAADGVMQESDWATKGTQDGHFTLEWKKAVEAAQVVYWARMNSSMLESFKDYEIYLNDAKTPAVKGQLERRRGPRCYGRLLDFSGQSPVYQLACGRHRSGIKMPISCRHRQ